MKALFVYSRNTGSSYFLRRLSFIKKKLLKRFEIVEMVESNSLEELKKFCELASREYDYFIFAGGDGTVNLVINNFAQLERKPILGYLPAGTINDFAKNFRISKDIHWALRNIIKGVPAPFDVVKVNDRYVAYVLACGAYSDISYVTKRGIKKKMGFLAYYLLAMRELFIAREIRGTLKCNDKTYDIRTPFLLVLNGNHVGGFYVNLKNKINDGKFNIFITRPGVFNGLLHYLFFKIKTVKITTDHFTFSFEKEPENWCVDGELANLGNVDVKCCPSFLKLIVPKRIAKKLIAQAEPIIEKHE